MILEMKFYLTIHHIIFSRVFPVCKNLLTTTRLCTFELLFFSFLALKESTFYTSDPIVLAMTNLYHLLFQLQIQLLY